MVTKDAVGRRGEGGDDKSAKTAANNDDAGGTSDKDGGDAGGGVSVKRKSNEVAATPGRPLSGRARFRGRESD